MGFAAFATYSAWWLSRDVVGRLGRAKQLFREIAAEKHDGPVDISRADEVGSVLLGLKSMQVRLEFSTQRLRRQAAESSRINQALDRAETNIMVADRRFTVVFANRAVLETFRKHEARIASVMPGFKADAIVGSSIDRFHRDPRHQRTMLEGMKQPHHARIEIAGLIFDFTVTPAFGHAGMLIGYVVEWKDRTLELAIEREVQDVVAAEVRALAQRSAASAKEIKALIAGSVEAVRAGSDKVAQAGDAIRSLVGEVEKMGQLVAEISAASEEQAQGIVTVNQTVSQLDMATQQNAALVEEAASSFRLD